MPTLPPVIGFPPDFMSDSHGRLFFLRRASESFEKRHVKVDYVSIHPTILGQLWFLSRDVRLQAFNQYQQEFYLILK